MFGKITAWIYHLGAGKGIITDLTGNTFTFTGSDVRIVDRKKIKLGLVVAFEAYIVKDGVRSAHLVSAARQKDKNEYLKADKK